jgi:hypothetical protein
MVEQIRIAQRKAQLLARKIESIGAMANNDAYSMSDRLNEIRQLVRDAQSL